MIDQLFQKKDPEQSAETMYAQKQLDASTQQNMVQAAVSDTTLLQEQHEKSDLIRWQQDLDEELMQLVLYLKGYRIEGNEFVKDEKARPMCNDLFIHQVVIPQCKPFMSRNLINSNFSELRVLEKLRYTAQTIVSSMSNGFDQYGIKTIRDQNLILRQIQNVIESGAFRSVNGWNKELDSTMIRRIESGNINAQQQQTRKGFLGGIFGN